eukprot:6212911-Pleurochrysis_carterae.AAC.1
MPTTALSALEHAGKCVIFCIILEERRRCALHSVASRQKQCAIVADTISDLHPGPILGYCICCCSCVDEGGNRRGGAEYPLRLWGLRFLDGASGVASPSTLLSRSRYLLQSLASSIAASDRDDYGRA